MKSEQSPEVSDSTTFRNHVLMEIFDALPYYVMLLDSDHRVLACNQALANMARMDREKVVGAYCPKLVHDVDNPIPECPLKKSAATGQLIENEVFFPEYNAWIRVMIYPTRMRTLEGRRIFIHLSRDITEEKRNQEERNRLEEENVHFQKVEAVGKLAAGIAHDFNNLLLVIQGYVELMINEIGSGRPKLEDAKEILKATKQASALTRQLSASAAAITSNPRS